MTENDDKYNFVGKVDLEVDKDRYLVGNLRWKDVIITLPFALLGALISYLLYKYSGLNFSSKGAFIIYAIIFSPAILVFISTSAQAIEYDRKEVKLINRVFYQRHFSKKKKIFQYTNDKINGKRDFMEDIRSQFGIYDISKECYELLDEDDHIVKVIQVSCINVTALPKSDQRKIYKSFETFNNKLDFRLFPIQITTKTTPINLDQYIENCREIFTNSENKADRLFGDSYLKFANDIQKDKKMVSKSPYIVIKRKKKSNEDSYQVLEELAERLVSSVENMLPSQYALKAKILNNEELYKLLHFSLDYQNANILTSNNIDSNSIITFSDQDNKEFDEYWKNKQESKIM